MGGGVTLKCAYSRVLVTSPERSVKLMIALLHCIIDDTYRFQEIVPRFDISANDLIGCLSENGIPMRDTDNPMSSSKGASQHIASDTRFLAARYGPIKADFIADAPRPQSSDAWSASYIMREDPYHAV